MTNDNYRHALKVELTDANENPIFETIEELKLLMQRKGFRKSGKYPNIVDKEPTDSQLNYAYNYLTRYSQVTLEDYGIEEEITYIWGKRKAKRDPVTGRFMK